MAKKAVQDESSSNPMSVEDFPKLDSLNEAQLLAAEQQIGSASPADVAFSPLSQVNIARSPAPQLAPQVSSGPDGEWREIAREWKAIADYWKSATGSGFSTATPSGMASLSAAPLVGGDGGADEICFLIAADTTSGGPLQSARNIPLMQQLTSLANQPVGSVQILQGTNCNDSSFSAGLSSLAARASQAKANNRNLKVVIHLSCHGNDSSLMVSSAQRQVIRPRAQYEALARQIRQSGATGVLFLCDCCAVGTTGGAGLESVAGAPIPSTAGRTYLNYFNGFVTINGCSPPPAGPNQTGEVCVYASDRGGLFTNSIFNTLTNVNFTLTHNGFVNSVTQGVASLFNSYATNGGISIDGKTYTRQKPFYRVLEP